MPMSDSHPTRSPAFVFAGGGTGGHIFPALAIAERLRERCPGARAHFLVSERPLDAEILAKLAESHEPLPAKPLIKRPLALARFAMSWGPSVRAARAAIQSLRADGPVALVAMGGFVSPPAVQGARAERAPVTLVNLDAVPGLANRWVAKRAHDVVTSTPVPGRAWELVGPIVRRAALPPADAPECRRRLGLDPDRPTLFVSGGSQGARSINTLMPALARTHADALSVWQVVHQSGRDADPDLAGAYDAVGVRASVVEFIDAVGLAWGAADLAIGRAGAGTVAEAWATRTPTVFLPYPYHADEHQRRNAEPLASAGGAVILTDHIDPDANLAEHGPELADLLASADRRARMRQALEALGPADGADRVAQRLLASRS